MEHLVFDCQKRHTYAVVEDEKGRVHWEGKSSMSGGLWLRSSKKCQLGSPVAVETVGN